MSSAKKYLSIMSGRYDLPKNGLLIFWEIALDDVFQDSHRFFCGHIAKELAQVLFNGFLSEEIQDMYMHQNTISSTH